MDRLHTMSVFVAVAEEMGFAPAARRLNMSPPAVTRAVSALEQRLGAKLLHRTTRAVQLTEAGQRYLVDCKRVLAEVDEIDQSAAGIHASPRGKVTVTASVLFGRMVVVPILLDLLEQYPDIEIDAFYVDRVTNLMDEGLDVAVRIADLPDSGLSAVRVGSVRRVLCAAPQYLAERGSPDTPSGLATHDLIDFVNLTRTSDWNFVEDGKVTSMRPGARFRVNNGDAAIAAAVSGRGITRVLSYMIAPQLADGSLELVLDAFALPPVPVHVVHKETGQPSARVRAVFDFLAERLRADEGLDH
ncbi:MAG: LysR family transcriptional regulator [Rhodospirillaceae bacterium]|nr:LysR family transcriptional regulator [Rhodospirillaceae bacterium]